MAFKTRLGLWNIDHPETTTGSRSREKRFALIKDFISDQGLDVLVTTEANSALSLPGMEARFSDISPFTRKGRCYDPPNAYHQVGIYSKAKLKPVRIDEPMNGLLCSIMIDNSPLYIYGNVVTIKDRWKPESSKTYSDRLREQISVMELLSGKRFIILGDFNLRKDWKKTAYKKVEELVESKNWVWPTREYTDTVQHVVHSNDLSVELSLDQNVKIQGLSDHPFLAVDLASS